MNEKNFIIIYPKNKKKKEPHRMGKVRAMRILFLFYVFYIFVSKKKNCELFIHVTTPSEGEKNRKKMHLVGNLVEPQQYCHIHIERKYFGTPNLLKKKKTL